MEEVLLAEVWQVVRDGELQYELRIPVATDRMPTQVRSQSMYAEIVCRAVEQAVAGARKTIGLVT